LHENILVNFIFIVRSIGKMSANEDDDKSQLSNYSLIVITDLNLNKLIYNIDIIYRLKIL